MAAGHDDKTQPKEHLNNVFTMFLQCDGNTMKDLTEEKVKDNGKLTETSITQTAIADFSVTNQRSSNQLVNSHEHMLIKKQQESSGMK